ncbi:hypothetical protein QCA50_007348 [Cerrena zonata]|uniref:O-methyltransferase domain-containing protein n=1 Tax=Cerrena zonata TaxID=2478898 RepID=A0AAW0G886_9APHY
MTFATLRALHTIIGAALDDIEQVYHDADPSSQRSQDTQNVPSPSTPPYTPPPSANLQNGFKDLPDNPSPPLHHVVDNPPPPSVLDDSFPAPKAPRERKVGRERARTLPPIATPPLLNSNPPPMPIPNTIKEEPLDFPSLDEPRYVKDRDGCKRTQLQDEIFSNPQVISAVNKLVAACGQLSISVQKPFLVLCDAGMGYHLPSCLRFLEASHTVEILREAGEQGLHVKDIAKRIRGLIFPDDLDLDGSDPRKEIDPGKLSHILRLLATHHITREVRPDVFANNRISSYLDSGKDLDSLTKEPQNKYEDTDGNAAFVGLCTDELFKASAYLTDCYLPTKTHSPPLSPTSPIFSISPTSPISPTSLTSPTSLASPTSPISPWSTPPILTHTPSSPMHTKVPPNTPLVSFPQSGGGNPPMSPLRQQFSHQELSQQYYHHQHTHSTSFSSIASSYGEVSTENMDHTDSSNTTPPTPNRSGKVFYHTPSTPSGRTGSQSRSDVTPPGSTSQYTPPSSHGPGNLGFSSRLPAIPQSPVTPRQRQPSDTPSSPTTMNTPTSVNHSTSTSVSTSSSNNSFSNANSTSNWHMRKGSLGTRSTASLSPMTFPPNPSPVQSSGDGLEGDGFGFGLSVGNAGNFGVMGRVPGTIRVPADPPPTPSSPLSLRKRIPLLRKTTSKPLLLGSSSPSPALISPGGELGGELAGASTISLPMTSSSGSKSLLGAPFSYSGKKKSKSRERKDDETTTSKSDSNEGEGELAWDSLPSSTPGGHHHLPHGEGTSTIRGHKQESTSKGSSLLSLKGLGKNPSVGGQKAQRPTISPPMHMVHTSGSNLSSSHLRSPSSRPSLTSLSISSPSLRSPASSISLRKNSASPTLGLGIPTISHGMYANDDAYPSSTLLPMLSSSHSSSTPFLSIPNSPTSLTPPVIPPRSPLRESPSLMSIRSMVVGPGVRTVGRKDSTISLPMTSSGLGVSTTSLVGPDYNPNHHNSGRGKPLPTVPPSLPSSSLTSLGSLTSLDTYQLHPHSHYQQQRRRPPLVNAGSGSGSSPKHITSSHPMHAPFNLAFRTSKPYFDWLEEKENVGRFKRFGKAMTGTGGWEVSGAILEGFPWMDLPEGSVVVDVGGGIGSTSMLLAKAFGHLRFVIQDRPQVAEMGFSMWKTRCPELLDEGRAAFLAHDFFGPQPPIPASVLGGRDRSAAIEKILDGLESTSPAILPSRSGLGLDERIFERQDRERSLNQDLGGAASGELEKKPAVFLLRVVTHDWPNLFVTRILLRLRKAAGPDTKLLLADYILPLACVDEDSEGGALPGMVKSLAPEGSPLLPNLGKANANAYWLDLTMRVTFNSQERTLRELTALTLTAGWKVVQVTRAEGTLFGHIIAVPVDIPEESLALLNDISPEDAVLSPINDPDVYSPPMGGTFFSRVDLPSDEIIRSGISKPKFTFKSLVASASENLGLKPKSKHNLSPTATHSNPRFPSSSSGGGGRRRNRAYTITGTGAGALNENEIPPLPSFLPIGAEVSFEAGEKMLFGGRNVSGSGGGGGGGGGEVAGKKGGGWKTLVKMLSKPQIGHSPTER